MDNKTKQATVIFQEERKELLNKLHAYHAKYKIPYNHDELKDLVENIILTFTEGH